MKDTIIYGEKSLSELLKDVHHMTLKKHNDILTMVGELRRQVTNAETAVIFAPIIKDFLDVLVKNDDHLLKLATIVQRIVAVEVTGKSGDLDQILSDEERDHLVKQAMKDLDLEVEKLLPSGSVSPTP